MPFLIEGTVLTGISGVISAIVYGIFMLRMQDIMGDLSTFLPKVQLGNAIQMIMAGLLIGAISLGVVGSFFGLKLVKQK
jgi:hypothetical protein